jgi:hypothetical protein
VVAPLVLSFGGIYAGIDVPDVTIDTSSVVGGGTGTVVPTTPGGLATYVGGAERPGVPLLWQPLMVFDKAGAYLGSVKAFNVTSPPVRYLRSMRVLNEGGMTFRVSRHSPDIDLIASDRLVQLQSLRGEKPWVGTMSPQASTGGIQEVECRDFFTILRDGSAITLKEDVSDFTPATAIYQKIMGLHNDLRSATGEVQWELDLQGSRPFRGDLDVDANTLAIVDNIILRSRTEVAINSRLNGNSLVPILSVRDRFDAGAGAPLFDGPLGNVTSGVQGIEDPQPLVFSLRLRGLTTDLAKCLPLWAQWALQNVTPEVTVSVDPGAYRNRQRRDETVDWGLSHAAINAQCNAILDWLWELYHSFLRAFHDIEGMPWHPANGGWAYLGPPDIYEPKSAGKDSLSRRAWRPRQQLVETTPGTPAAAVMLSDQHSQINLREWLIVLFNRVTELQRVSVYGIPLVAGAALIKWNVGAGGATLYLVSGGRVISSSTIASTGAFVEPYSVRIYVPSLKRYLNMRRIISGPFNLLYYVYAGDPDNTFIDLGPDAAISQRAGDGSSLIDTMYDFERLAIENWDPRRDGIGVNKVAPTVYFGEETNRPRWHVTSFNVGTDALTSITSGIGPSAPGVANDIEVASIFGFPDPDLDAAAFPFLIEVDDGLDMEQMLVLSMTGALWHVLRGQGGTAAIIHEPNAPVSRPGNDPWLGFPFPYTWPEGQAWAEELLAELSRPRIDLSAHVSHFRGDQLTIDYGSMHSVNVASEGPPGRWIGDGKRSIGWSTNAAGQETEVITEWGAPGPTGAVTVVVGPPPPTAGVIGTGIVASMPPPAPAPGTPPAAPSLTVIPGDGLVTLEW